MLKMARPGIEPDEPGKIGPLKLIESLKERATRSPMSATWSANRLQPQIRHQLGAVVDRRGYPLRPEQALWRLPPGRQDRADFLLQHPGRRRRAADHRLRRHQDEHGRCHRHLPYEGVVKNHDSGAELSRFSFKSDVLLDEVQAGGRINLIIGRGLTDWAREVMGLAPSTVFRRPVAPQSSSKGFTWRRRWSAGVRRRRHPPRHLLEPKMTTVGSQDTTGPMTRDELKDLACLGFSADLVMQSFCHTAAYPKPVDVQTHHTLPDFISSRAGVALRPATASSTPG